MVKKIINIYLQYTKIQNKKIQMLLVYKLPGSIFQLDIDKRLHILEISPQRLRVLDHNLEGPF